VPETTEFLYVYPKGFFPERRTPEAHDVGDTVTDSGLEFEPDDVMGVAAEDGDDLIVLKLTRVDGMIADVQFYAAVSAGPAHGHA
jgi:hypothetical protein